jgi:hypothetical protein
MFENATLRLITLRSPSLASIVLPLKYSVVDTHWLYNETTLYVFNSKRALCL